MTTVVSTSPQTDAQSSTGGISPVEQTEANQLQGMIDQVYKNLLTLSNGNFNTQNAYNVVFQLVQDCDTFSIPVGNKAAVILGAIDQFCTEHGQSNAIFAFVEPFIKFSLNVADGTITINVKVVEADVSACFPSLSCLKPKN